MQSGGCAALLGVSRQVSAGIKNHQEWANACPAWPGPAQCFSGPFSFTQSPWDVTQTLWEAHPRAQHSFPEPGCCPTQGVSCSSPFLHQQIIIIIKKSHQVLLFPNQQLAHLSAHPMLCPAGSAAWSLSLPNVPNSIPSQEKMERRRRKSVLGR